MTWNAVAAFSALGLLAAACQRASDAPPGFQGIVELDERVLAFEVAGRIMEVPVRRGDLVTDGVVVARLDDTLEALTRRARADEEASARADLSLLEAGTRREDIGSAAAEVNAAAAAEELAKKNADRIRALHERDSVAQAELDSAESALERARAERRALSLRHTALRNGARPEELARARAHVEAAHAVVELEDARLARFALRARSDGLVLDVHVRADELAAVGTPAATVADVTHPYVDVFVPVGSLGGPGGLAALRIGTHAEVHVDARPAAAGGVPGEIEYISPRTEFTPRFLFSDRERPNLVIRVRVRIHDSQRVLHAGVPAFVSFIR